MTDPARHPAWCAFRYSDPRRCFEQEAHHGAQIAINPEGNELIGLRLHLVQLIVSDGEDLVYAHLIVTDDEQERTYPLTIRQLSMLSMQTRREVELIREQQRPRNEGPR